MPRGGKRLGTPGKGYANRTDLDTNYNNTTSAASGGIKPQPMEQPANAAYPEDTPMLSDPTARPNEPITAGLDIGPGPGSGASDPRVDETVALRKWLPIIEPLLDQPDVPNSVRTLVRYIRVS
jgi:hypothetical protein